MPALRDTLNYRNIILDGSASEGLVKVLLRSGEYREVFWLGFVGIEQARAEGHPVRLKVHAYANEPGQWIALAPGEHMQGCLRVGSGVYGVLNQGKCKVV